VLHSVKILKTWIESFYVDHHESVWKIPTLTAGSFVASSAQSRHTAPENNFIFHFASEEVPFSKIGLVFYPEKLHDESYVIPATMSTLGAHRLQLRKTQSKSEIVEFVAKLCRREIPGFTDGGGSSIKELVLVFNSSEPCDFFVIVTSAHLSLARVLPYLQNSLEREVPTLTTENSLHYCGKDSSSSQNAAHEAKYCLIWLRGTSTIPRAQELSWLKALHVLPAGGGELATTLLDPFSLVAVDATQEPAFAEVFDFAGFTSSSKKKSASMYSSANLDPAHDIFLIAFGSSMRGYATLMIKNDVDIVTRAEHKIPALLAMFLEGRKAQSFNDDKVRSSNNPFLLLGKDRKGRPRHKDPAYFHVKTTRYLTWMLGYYYANLPFGNVGIIVLIWLFFKKFNSSPAASSSRGDNQREERPHASPHSNNATANGPSSTRNTTPSEGQRQQETTSTGAAKQANSSSVPSSYRDYLYLSQADMNATNLFDGFLVLIFIPKDILLLEEKEKYSFPPPFQIPTPLRRDPKLRFRIVHPRHRRWWQWLQSLDSATRTTVPQDIPMVALRLKKRMAALKPTDRQFVLWIEDVLGGTVSFKLPLPLSSSASSSSSTSPIPNDVGGLD